MRHNRNNRLAFEPFNKFMSNALLKSAKTNASWGLQYYCIERIVKRINGDAAFGIKFFTPGALIEYGWYHDVTKNFSRTELNGKDGVQLKRKALSESRCSFAYTHIGPGGFTPPPKTETRVATLWGNPIALQKFCCFHLSHLRTHNGHRHVKVLPSGDFGVIISVEIRCSLNKQTGKYKCRIVFTFGIYRCTDRTFHLPAQCSITETRRQWIENECKGYPSIIASRRWLVVNVDRRFFSRDLFPETNPNTHAHPKPKPVATSNSTAEMLKRWRSNPKLRAKIGTLRNSDPAADKPISTIIGQQYCASEHRRTSKPQKKAQTPPEVQQRRVFHPQVRRLMLQAQIAKHRNELAKYAELQLEIRNHPNFVTGDDPAGEFTYGSQADQNALG